jgi:hypothetical protein
MQIYHDNASGSGGNLPPIPYHIQEAIAGMVQCEARGAEDPVHEFRNMANFRSAAPFPSERQIEIDEISVNLGSAGQVLVPDLISAGLVRPLPGWLGILEFGYYRLNQVGHARRVMDLNSRGERAVPDRTRVVHPVWATIEDFSFDARELANAERMQAPLDVDLIENSFRNVNEAIEDQAWNGLGFNFNGNTAPGVLTTPTNAVTYSGDVGETAWNHANKTGTEIMTDIGNMLAMAKADRRGAGPYNLYVPSDYYTSMTTRLYSDGVTTFDRTQLEVLGGIRGGNSPITIKEADFLPANRTALIQMTRDNIDVLMGQAPATVSWTSGNGFLRYWMIIACMVIRVKTDYNNGSGIVVGNV